MSRICARLTQAPFSSAADAATRVSPRMWAVFFTLLFAVAAGGLSVLVDWKLLAAVALILWVLVAALRKPPLLLVLIIALSNIDQFNLVWAIPYDDLMRNTKIIVGPPISLVLIGLCLGFGRKIRIPVDHDVRALFLPLVLFFIYAVFSGFWAAPPQTFLVAIVALFSNLLVFLFFVSELSDYRQLVLFLKYLSVWILLRSFVIAGSYFLPTEYFFDWPLLHDLSAGAIVRGGWTVMLYEALTVRPSSFFAEYHFEYMVTNCMAAGALASMMVSTRRLPRLFFAALFVLNVLLVTTTATRGGGIGLLAMTVFIAVVLSRNMLERLVMTAVMVLMFILVVYSAGRVTARVMGSAEGQRVLPTAQSAGKTADVQEGFLPESRRNIWRDNWRMFTQSGMLGIGAGSYGFNERHGWGHPHSIYGSVAAEFGIPGILALVWAGVLMMRVFVRTIFLPVSGPRSTALVLLAGLVAVAVNGIVDFFITFPFIWCWAALSLAACVAALRAEDMATVAGVPQRAVAVKISSSVRRDAEDGSTPSGVPR